MRGQKAWPRVLEHTPGSWGQLNVLITWSVQAPAGTEDVFGVGGIAPGVGSGIECLSNSTSHV